MRVLVLGGSGMLGSDLVPELKERGHDVLVPTRQEMDLKDLEKIATIAQLELDWVINCAAYTAVDQAESEPDDAAWLNTLVPRYVAMACALGGCRMVHISTDFVFDGQTEQPYKEDAETNPLQVYGQTKRDGEEAVLSALPTAWVVRTSWLYGVHGKSFPRTMIGAKRAGRALRVVADQVGCPTFTPELARVLADLIEIPGGGGLLHASGPDAMSWFEFARHILGQEADIEPIPSEAWPTPAKRPCYSVLDCAKLATLGIAPMEPATQSIARFLAALEC